MRYSSTATLHYHFLFWWVGFLLLIFSFKSCNNYWTNTRLICTQLKTYLMLHSHRGMKTDFHKFFQQNVNFWHVVKDSGYTYTSDKTLFCAFEDNFKQNGIFWCQRLPAVRVWTWPKYNKHHHDFKKLTMPLYRYVHTENILADGTMSRMPRKRDLGTGLGRVRFRFLTQTRLALLSSAQLFDVFFYRLG